MNKKIKIIELLNKIANGEDVPIEIKFRGIIYILNKTCNQYYERGKGSYFENKLSFDKTIEWNFYGDFLNEEVEVLEDSLEDNTEEIEEYKGETFEQLGYEVGKMSMAIAKGLEKAIKEMRKDLNKC